MNDPQSIEAGKSKRYDGLDAVRATAMLLGVFYHLPISMYTMFAGGGFGGPGAFGGGSPKQPIDDWLHSFRMPLFFLISGFFANMMMRKYGWYKFLTRRWWRIGAPLFVTLAILFTFRAVMEQKFGVNVNPFAPPAVGAEPAGPGAMPRPGFSAAPPTSVGIGGTPPAMGNGQGAGAMGFGPPGFGAPGFGPPGFGPPAGMGAAPAGPPPMLNFPVPKFPENRWSAKLFKEYARYLGLEHLWFLWYLLIFVTAGPVVVVVIERCTRSFDHQRLDRAGALLFRFNGFALLFGLLTVPALLHACNFTGWSLTNPQGFMGAFPDFLCTYYQDQPFYFMYFIAGWWLFRLQDQLPMLASRWLWNLTLGVLAFAVSQQLAKRYAFQFGLEHYQSLRYLAFALYAFGSASSACGFIGFFQTFLDTPARITRYFADTALWVYLVHLPLIPYVIWWAQPASGPWWVGSLAGMVIVTGVSLVLFELLVRPTPLVHLYGPPRAAKVKQPW